jgi:ornithine cyclodeaminase/alanine dehydrogenase
MRTTIQIVEMALRELALGHVVMPPQTSLRLPGQGSVHRVASAFVGGEVQALGFQVLTSHPHNRGHYLPTTIGTLMLSDPDTGVPLVIMDATFLTAMRDGASGAVAVNYLARQKVNEVVVLGAGAQARTQLMGICAVRDVNGALVLDPDAGACRRFADQMSKALNIPIESVDDVRAAIEMADVIVTATRAAESLFQGQWLRPGVHINAVGAHSPETRGLDTETIRRAKVVTDLSSVCLAEAGDLILPIQEGAITEAHVHADLGQVIAGLKPGRENEDEVTLFKAVGLAAQDVAIAFHLQNLARLRGVGRQVDL